MNFHQTPEEIIKHATAEQRILWNDIFLRYGEKVAIQQYHYCGTLGAAQELKVYSARKLYFALDLKFGHSSGHIIDLVGYIITFYDAANVACFSAHKNSIAWNTTTAALNYIPHLILLKNITFSRVVTFYDMIDFTGYRLSI